MTVSGYGITLLLLAVSLATPSLAQETELSEGFLEYLATMIEDDGEWIDPLTLEDDQIEVADASINYKTVNDETDTAEETR